MKTIRNMTAAVADAMAAVSLFVGRGADENEPLGGCRFERDIIRDSYSLITYVRIGIPLSRMTCCWMS